MYMIRYRLRTSTEWRSVLANGKVAALTHDEAHALKEKMENSHGLTHTYNVYPYDGSAL